MHLFGEEELEAAGLPAETRRPLPLTPQTLAEAQALRLQELLEQRRELLDSRAGFGAPIGMLAGSVGAAAASVLLLTLAAPLLPSLGTTSYSGSWGGLNTLAAVFVVLIFVVGCIAGVAHVVLGALFGPVLDRQISSREDTDRRVKLLDADIEEAARQADGARAQ